MGEIKVEDKTRVVPGDVIATGMDYLPSMGTYRNGDDIIAKRFGVVKVDGKVIKLIPIRGRYEPRKNDVVIGRIDDILLYGWKVEFGTAYTAILSVQEGSSEYIEKGADLTKYFDIGDHIIAKITNVTSQKLVDISTRGFGLKKLHGGRFISVNSFKVPRIIGKGGSMVTMVKKATDTNILVGQNGVIWINGKDPQMELTAVDAIKKIEQEAHISGLTDRMKAYLEEKTGKTLENEKKSEDNNDQSDDPTTQGE